MRSSPPNEFIRGRPKTWEEQVRSYFRNACSGCGATESLEPTLVVPKRSGGQETIQNSALLCRKCVFNKALESVEQGSNEPERLINFWVSSSLYEWMQNAPRFKSMGAMVRFLMTQYVLHEKQYEDIEQYQDVGTDTKVNVWVYQDIYENFKALIDKRGMTITDAFKALLKRYQIQENEIKEK